MTDENRDPSCTKMRPKAVDAKSAAASPLVCSVDSPKSATITNVSQRLPSTSVEVSVGDILSTDDKRASVSVRKQQPRYSSSSCSSSEFDDIAQSTFTTTHKMDLGEATRELTRLLHIGNDNTTNEIQLNPDAPDFTPLDFSPTYRSELAPAHLRRRATQIDHYHGHHLRSRYYSESYPSAPTSNSPIRPLLSLIPQHFPYNRQSWNSSNMQSSTSNSWWQNDYNNSPSLGTSYHSKPAYSPYSPLMPPLTDDSVYPNRHSSKRPRVNSTRAFVFPNQTTMNRKRSHSGPETPLQPPPTHLNGIHSLTKIMIDILRMIDPLPKIEEPSKKSESTLPTQNLSADQQDKSRQSSSSSIQHSLQQRNESNDTEDVFINDEIPTIAGSISNKVPDVNDGQKVLSKSVNANEQQQAITTTSTDTTALTSKHCANDESFYEVTPNEESSTPTSVSPTSA